jgi:hypothetical protein
MVKKVILSALGEVTRDTRTIGDTFRYRIYYSPPLRAAREIVITDRLPLGLSQVTVFHGGRYNARKRTIAWQITTFSPRRKAYVEFTARLNKVGTIQNQAQATGLGNKIVKSNTVQTIVHKSPRLGWIPFGRGSKASDPPVSYMKDEITMGLTVNFDLPGMTATKKVVNGVAYQRLHMIGAGSLTEVGFPELPIAGAVVEVPFGVHLQAEIVKSSFTRLVGYQIYPAQPPLIAAKNPAAEPAPLPAEIDLAIDRATYLRNAIYPDELATVAEEDIIVMRGHRLAFIKVNPVQYNPVKRELLVYNNIEVRLNFDQPAQIEKIEPRLRSIDYEALLRSTILNFKESWRHGEDAPGNNDKEPPPDCDYLIITADALYNAADPNNPIVKLRNWKTRKGYRTRVVKVGSIQGGNTPASIKAYLQNAYDHWNPVPTYVLLVGDADSLATNTGAQHPSHNNLTIGTDLDYACLDGTDYFPDLFLGRLPVDSITQATDVIDKIINYEQNPPATPANAAIYRNVSLIGLFSDEDIRNGVLVDPIDGTDGRPWIANLETIRNFLVGRNYTVERIYVTNSGFPANPNADDPTDYDTPPNPLPNDLVSPQYPWNATDATITNAFNAGRFLITYRDHGDWNAWSHPEFDNTDVNNLNNQDLLPVVFSIACLTGFFDNETCAAGYGKGAGDECFCELLLRRPQRGAVVVIGGTRITSTGWNDALMWGLHKAIWPGFVPAPASTWVPVPGTALEAPLLHLGQVLSYGKVYMAIDYNHSDARQRHFEMYHLFGDPEMPIWTAAPGDLKVEMPKGIGAIGTQDFIVTVADKTTHQPISAAVVALTKDNNLVQYQQTDPLGVARFTLADLGNGDLDLTVTVLGFRPYMSVLVVTASGGVATVDPQGGPEHGIFQITAASFDGNEDVDIYLGDTLVKTVTAAGGSFGGLAAPVDVQVPQPFAHGLVNVLCLSHTSNRCAVDVFQVRDANPVDLWTYCQWDHTTWGGAAGPVWNSPDIQLITHPGGVSVASNNLHSGDTYKVCLNLYNHTAITAVGARVIFRWENFGMGGPWQNWHTVSVDDTNATNNKGQENLHVGETSSPSEICFDVWNPTKKPAAVYLEARQLSSPEQEGERRLWGSWIVHPDPQVIPPGGRARACIVIDPDPAKAYPGQEAEFAVTGFIGREMIGGVNVRLRKI